MAQDSTEHSLYSQDTCIATTVNEYDKLLKYFILEKTEINQLYKIDLLALGRKHFNFAYEHKLGTNYSMEYEATYSQFLYSINNNLPKSYYDAQHFIVLSANIKYYHNFHNRIKKGKNTNGFSGNYFLIGANIRAILDKPANWYPHLQYDENTIFTFGKMEIPDNMVFLSLGYGIQRKIGKIGYWATEAKIGFGSNKDFSTYYIPVELNIKAGFAISSLKRNN